MTLDQSGVFSTQSLPESRLTSLAKQGGQSPRPTPCEAMGTGALGCLYPMLVAKHPLPALGPSILAEINEAATAGSSCQHDYSQLTCSRGPSRGKKK